MKIGALLIRCGLLYCVQDHPSQEWPENLVTTRVGGLLQPEPWPAQVVTSLMMGEVDLVLHGAWITIFPFFGSAWARGPLVLYPHGQTYSNFLSTTRLKHPGP